MTSEKITYKPITEKSANPELIIFKTGKVEYREKNGPTKRPLSNVRRINSMTGQKEPKEGLDTSLQSSKDPSSQAKRLPKMEQANPKGRLVNNIPLTSRNPADKTAVGASSLQVAEGFPLSVKITPKTHPANDHFRLQP